MPYGDDSDGLLSAHEGTDSVLCDHNGDLGPDPRSGYFHRSTRHLSDWALRLNGQAPMLRASHPVDDATQLFLLTNAELGSLDRDSVGIRRRRTIGRGLEEEVRVTNHLGRPVEVELSLWVGVDFCSVKEVRENRLIESGHLSSEVPQDALARFEFGRKHFRASTELKSSKPAAARRVAGEMGSGLGDQPPLCCNWTLALAARETWTTLLTVSVEVEEKLALARDREGARRHRLPIGGARRGRRS